MVMASWPPAGRRTTHLPPSGGVRRRVDRALRRETWRSVRIGTPLIAAGIGADALHVLLRFGEAAVPVALLDAGAITLVAAIGFLSTRVVRRPEWPALVTLAIAFGLTLANMRLLPAAFASSVAYLAIVLVISGLFLPWTPRWHASWLLMASAMVVANGLLGPGLEVDRQVAVAALMTTAIAASASLVGQRLAYGRLDRLLEHQFQLRVLSRHATRQEAAVEELNRELVRTARMDTVTGIGNRRALDEALARLANRRLAAVLLDVDHFKAFNDRNGHLAGDAALARVGSVLRRMVRDADLVFRYGGEEFLILIPDADRHGAGALAERVRQAIETETASDLGLTVSAGVAVADRFSSSSPLPLLRRADTALYRAKRTGRNRVVVDGVAPLSDVPLAG